jgi:hypothetical protein
MSLRPRFLYFFVLLLLVLVQCSQTSQEEIVSIPDSAFLQALLELGIDTNGDGLISYPEAEASISINLSPSNISDLSGLEAFVNLDSLRIHMNPLAELDLSQNTSLKYLSCTGCQLGQLDLSHNPNLIYLDCSGGASMSNHLSQLDLTLNLDLEILDCSENRLVSLDLSNNQNLIELSCGRNQIEKLDVSINRTLTKLLVNNNLLTYFDVSNNTALTKLITCGNQLTGLDVSVNKALVALGVDNMATIYEVCVWTTPFPPPGVKVLSDFSPNVYFTTNCQD